VVRAFLEARDARPLSDDDEQAVNHLYEWISAAALPSPVFAVTFDGTADISDGVFPVESDLHSHPLTQNKRLNKHWMRAGQYQNMPLQC
jgi:hypothetical protein